MSDPLTPSGNGHRGQDGRFLPGSPKPENSGRKPGTPNKVSQKALEQMGKILEDPEFWEALKRQAMAGKAHSVVRYILERFAGKAKDTVEIQSSPSSDEYDLSKLTREERMLFLELSRKCVVPTEENTANG